MAETSAISWTHATFNGWAGCTKVSPACDNCYAERDTLRRGYLKAWGPNAPRRITRTWGEQGTARGAFLYLDPPYLNATGYGWDMPRRVLLQLAERWEAGGSVVAVSEAVPLELAGWHQLELTIGRKAEWLTLSRPPARVPERQLALFGGEP